MKDTILMSPLEDTQYDAVKRLAHLQKESIMLDVVVLIILLLGAASVCAYAQFATIYEVGLVAGIIVATANVTLLVFRSIKLALDINTTIEAARKTLKHWHKQ